jgi:ABC-type nickel/cobalt efflux system permease component RcnA
MEVLYGWLIGVLIGMRHSLEPDHLAAVSTIVAEHREKRVGLILGAAWGVGHTLTLVVAGGVLILLRKQMSPHFESAAELAVACMLIGLGARAIYQSWREGKGGLPHQHHHHGHKEHEHDGAHDHVHMRNWTIARRPLLVGLVHGLAGSGALTAAVLASMPSIRSGLVYILLFGVGSAVGMALLTGVTGHAMAGLVKRRRMTAMLLASSGVLSLALGVFWGWKHAWELFG